MSDDLERRLRDSLQAYAELVDPPDDDRLPARPAAARPVRWRGAVLAAAAAAAVVIGAMVVVDVRGTDAESAAGSSVPATHDTRADAPEADSGAAAAAGSEGLAGSGAPVGGFSLPPSPQVGVAYGVDLYTHCGVLGLDMNGVWFAADVPLVEEGSRPPPDWGNPEQQGTVTLLTSDRAVFRDDAGHEVRLHADESARPPLCA